jgi:hypothetical protein
MRFVRKSSGRSYNQKRAKHRANQRAAKERKRLARLGEVIPYPAHLPSPPDSSLRFKITIECLTDGERSSFTTAETALGWSISPTLAAQKVAMVLKHYRPAASA